MSGRSVKFEQESLLTTQVQQQGEDVSSLEGVEESAADGASAATSPKRNLVRLGRHSSDSKRKLFQKRSASKPVRLKKETSPRTRSTSLKSPRSKITAAAAAAKAEGGTDPAVAVRFQEHHLSRDYMSDVSAECDALLQVLTRRVAVLQQRGETDCNDSEEQNATTMALIKLSTTYLPDAMFSTSWLAREGVKVLVDLLSSTPDKTRKTLTLRCLVQLINQGSKLKNLSAGDQLHRQLRAMVQVCLQLLQDEARAVVVSSLQVIQKVCETNLKCVERADMDQLLALLSCPYQVKICAMQVINSVLSKNDSTWINDLDERGFLVAIIDHLVKLMDDSMLAPDTSDERFDHLSMKAVLLEQQTLRLRYLEDMQNEDFDPEKEDHMNVLRDLWSNVFPEELYEGASGDHWKRLGFQGKDPTTDLRGAGMLGLHCILFYAKNCTKQLRSNCRVMASNVSKGDPYYPIAAACVKMSVILLEELEDIQLMLFDGGKRPFERCFCGLMKFVHAEFLRMKLTYMDFTSILIPAVKARLRVCMEANLSSVNEFCDMLMDRGPAPAPKVSTPLFQRKASPAEKDPGLKFVGGKKLTPEEAEAKLRALQKSSNEETSKSPPRSPKRSPRTKSPRLRVRARFERTHSFDGRLRSKHHSATASVDPVFPGSVAESDAQKERIRELEAALVLADTQNQILTTQLEQLRQTRDPRASAMVDALFDVPEEDLDSHQECNATIADLNAKLNSTTAKLKEFQGRYRRKKKELSSAEKKNVELEATKELVTVLEEKLALCQCK